MGSTQGRLLAATAYPPIPPQQIARIATMRSNPMPKNSQRSLNIGLPKDCPAAKRISMAITSGPSATRSPLSRLEVRAVVVKDACNMAA